MCENRLKCLFFCDSIILEVDKMYYRRKIDDYLNNWKADPEHKPLIVKGARQIGKTESIMHKINANPCRWIWCGKCNLCGLWDVTKVRSRSPAVNMRESSKLRFSFLMPSCTMEECVYSHWQGKRKICCVFWFLWRHKGCKHLWLLREESNSAGTSRGWCHYFWHFLR